MPASSSLLRALLAGTAFCVAGSFVSLAHAEEEFPGALTDAADMECVPTCLMCHTNNPGTIGTYTKPLGSGLIGTGKLKPGAADIDAFNAAWATYAGVPANEANVALIKRGIEPGAMQDVCGPKYGCGASFARATPKG